jgi:20S proteasome subunit alpha 7
VPGTNKRVHHVTPCIGVAVTGLAADARQIVNRARDEAVGYKETYGDHISPSLLADRVSNYVHYFTMHGSLRPFGAATLLAGYDEELKEAQLYMVEPSGVSYRYFGCAIGKGKQGAKTEIEKLKLTEVRAQSFLCSSAANSFVKNHKSIHIKQS